MATATSTASVSTTTTTTAAASGVKALMLSLSAAKSLKGGAKIRASLACKEHAALLATLPDAMHARVSVACKGVDRGDKVTATLTVTVRAFALCVAFGGSIAPSMRLA